MKRFTKLYCVGKAGEALESTQRDAVPLLILQRGGRRKWLEPHYVSDDLQPLGRLRALAPAGPDDPNALLDACIAFYPDAFDNCPSMPALREWIQNRERLDFERRPHSIPYRWDLLREEARPIFDQLHVVESGLGSPHNVSG